MSTFNQVILAKTETYVESHCSTQSDLLRELERETFLKTVNPRMLSGEYQGKLLELISLFLQPKKILEIGTFTGYSAICLCRGLQNEGRLITLEKNEEYMDTAMYYFEKAGLKNQIELRIGDAKENINALKDTDFDLIFLDADKENYPLYYDLLLAKLRSGGVLLADNVLWSGKVWDKQQQDKDTLALRLFNEKAAKDSAVEVIILPLRDGISLIRKK